MDSTALLGGGPPGQEAWKQNLLTDGGQPPDNRMMCSKVPAGARLWGCWLRTPGAGCISQVRMTPHPKCSTAGDQGAAETMQ